MQRPKPSYSEKPTKNSADPSSSAARHIMQALDCQEARRDTEELQQYKSDFLEEQALPALPSVCMCQVKKLFQNYLPV